MNNSEILKKAKGGKMYSNYYSVDGQYFQYNTLDEVKWEISEENKIENNNQLQKYYWKTVQQTCKRHYLPLL